MKLITFQSIDALKTLVNTGVLETDSQKINMEKYGFPYYWITTQMEQHVPGKENVTFPLWCWVRFKNGICPPKHRGTPVPGFEVKITFRKPENEVFVTDYRRYSFVLNNLYIPENATDHTAFQKELETQKITAEELKAIVRRDKYSVSRNDATFLAVCKKIQNSFVRCITKDSDVLQGCVWRIHLKDVESIELLNDPTHTYGTFNYKRKDGSRFDWIEDYYRLLK